MEGAPDPEKARGAKRARGGAPRAAASFSCSVDGCGADLSGCKEYHRRHRVCEAHAKTPEVLVGGQRQRFCQQCSRFHLLKEFDEVKRSCRKRLDGHNRRRRKPQLPSVSGCVVPYLNGSGFYGHAQAFPSRAATPPIGIPLAKNGDHSLVKGQVILNFGNNELHSISSSDYRGGKQFPFLQDDDGSMATGVGDMMVEDLSLRSLDAILPPECGNDGTCKAFSSSAPSLLSSMTQTSTSNVCPFVPDTNQLPFGQLPFGQPSSIGPSKHHCSPIHYHGWTTACSEMENDKVGALLVPDSCRIDRSSPSVFHEGGGGSPDGPLQAVPFSWP